ncbi:hypothetical protein JXQ31_19750 [candidate division KSB1 bacterium]|nr:hypothetical protein [candidate division KSB1 bacterium]
MLEKDYLMRMIQQLTVALAKILFNKDIRNYDLALKEIDDAFKSMLGWDHDYASSLTSLELFDKLELIDGKYWEKCLVAAELINQEAQVYELKRGRSPLITDLYIKAFLFYLQVVENAQNYNIDNCFFNLEYIANILVNEELSPDFKYRLCRYFELSNQFDRAENIYYELMEEQEKDAKKKINDFYKRLLSRTDAELESGNLPRHEIEEGQRYLNKM